ncbi:MAG TPA: hypothetical protein VL522_03130 [Bordetella sp.]|jgi:hypothetical protein|nr:hypothetical protein [Bordetella sp.]
MAQLADHADINEILELFGCPADEEGRRSMLDEMRGIEQAARGLMRTHLRPGEFSKIAALAEASTAAQAILATLQTGR